MMLSPCSTPLGHRFEGNSAMLCGSAKAQEDEVPDEREDVADHFGFVGPLSLLAQRKF